MLLRRLFKRDVHFLRVQLARHRKFQIAITTGVIGSTFVGYVMPYHGEFALAAGVATNLLWIWEH